MLGDLAGKLGIPPSPQARALAPVAYDARV